MLKIYLLSAALASFTSSYNLSHGCRESWLGPDQWAANAAFKGGVTAAITFGMHMGSKSDLRCQADPSAPHCKPTEHPKRWIGPVLVGAFTAVNVMDARANLKAACRR